MIEQKVSVETEDGTIQANGVLVSGLCDHNPEVVGRMVKLENYVTDYKVNHFGEEYLEMCMDTMAWENAYRINNGYLG